MAYIVCWTCNGRGKISRVIPGQHVWDYETCDSCGGSGIDEDKTRNTTAILDSEKPTYLRKNFNNNSPT